MGYVLLFLVSALGLFSIYMLYRLEGVKKDLKGLIAIVERGIQQDLVQTTRQLQYLQLLDYEMRMGRPLPPTRAYAASPDFLLEIFKTARVSNPNKIVEFGSGVSTLVLARALQINGAGKLYSFDHDVIWAQKTSEMIDDYGLADYVEIIVAPVISQNINGEDCMWYDVSGIPSANIDMFVIDGPPISIDPIVRKPALDVLSPRLSNVSIGYLDDAARAGEKEIAEVWARKYPDIKQTYLYLEKGALRFEQK